MDATLICETSQIYYLMERHRMKDVSGNHLKDRSFRLVHRLSITLFLRKTSQESINLERKSYLDCSSDTLCTRFQTLRSTSTSQDLSTIPAQQRSDELAPAVRTILEKPKTKFKRVMAVEMRTTVCSIFLNGWRCSQIIKRTQRSACSRTHFSGLRFGTSCKSGIKMQEAQYFQSNPTRPKLRSLLANQNDKGSLQKTDALAKLYRVQQSLVT